MTHLKNGLLVSSVDGITNGGYDLYIYIHTHTYIYIHTHIYIAKLLVNLIIKVTDKVMYI